MTQPSKYTIHAILRSYIALATYEHYALADTKDFMAYYKTHSPQVNEAIKKHWNKSDDEIHKANVTFNPGVLTNKLISAKLRSAFFIRFDIKPKNALHFNHQGEFVYPNKYSFLVPVYDGNFIKQFRFYRIYKDKIEEQK